MVHDAVSSLSSRRGRRRRSAGTGAAVGGGVYSGTRRRRCSQHLVGPVVRRRVVQVEQARPGSRRPAATGAAIEIRGWSVGSAVLAGAEQLLVELLARAQPGEPERPRRAGSAAARSCSTRSTIRTGSPMSSTYVSAPSAIRAASRTRPTASSMVMKNRVTSGCGDGHRPIRVASCSRDHVQQRPAAAEHVAEADRRTARCGDPAVRAGAPARPAAWWRPRTEVGLAALSVEISTNRSTSWAIGGLDQVLGAADVGLHALAGVPLEQRQVLERGGVEDDLRAGARGRSGAIRSRSRMSATTTVVGVQQRLAPQLELQPVQVRLVVVEHDQLARAEAADLAAQLAADRAAGAGDQHPLAGDRRRGAAADHVHLGPADQRADLQRAHVACRRSRAAARPGTAAGGGRVRRGRRPAGRARAPGRGQRRDRDDHHVHGARGSSTSLQVVERCRGTGGYGRRPPAPRPASSSRKPDRGQPERADPLQVAGQRPAGLAGADDQRAQTGRLG